jgi:rSAM/selenodomain-associated transferase 1
MMLEPATTRAPRILGLFAKRPRLGQVKTRLAAETSAVWAEKAANTFLLDLVDKFADIADERFLVYTPPEENEYFSHLAGSHYKIRAQSDGDLGNRLHCFFLDQMRTGLERIVVLGSDSPTLPRYLVEQAYLELETSDVVIGPAMDGGYYLLGCARRLPPLFERISWGTRSVLAETMSRLADPGWKLAVLAPWYDVDTLEDWTMLRGHVAALRQAGTDPGIPRTERLLQCTPP